MVRPSCQSSQQKVGVYVERWKRQLCSCCRVKKWTWRRNSELSLSSWQCHTCYSGLTAAALTVLSNWPKSFYGRRSECVFACVCCRAGLICVDAKKVREISSAHFRSKQMVGNGDERNWSFLLKVFKIPDCHSRLRQLFLFLGNHRIVCAWVY